MHVTNEVAVATQSLSLVDSFLFSIIDRLNKVGAHTAPANIKSNIRSFLEKTSKKFVEFLPESAIGIDIGAGYGILSDVLKPRLIYNVDINPPKEGYHPQIRAKAENLPFEDETFDFATIFYAFNHFSNPSRAFEEANRVVKKRGHIVTMIEFLRYKGQNRFIRLNERSMNRIIFGEHYKPDNADNFFARPEFEGLIDKLSLNRRVVEDYKPTRRFDVVFKTLKRLYVLQKD
jgi:SAM-dependent methyltransferase